MLYSCTMVYKCVGHEAVSPTALLAGEHNTSAPLLSAYQRSHIGAAAVGGTLFSCFGVRTICSGTAAHRQRVIKVPVSRRCRPRPELQAPRPRAFIQRPELLCRRWGAPPSCVRCSRPCESLRTGLTDGLHFVKRPRVVYAMRKTAGPALADK